MCTDETQKSIGNQEKGETGRLRMKSRRLLGMRSRNKKDSEVEEAEMKKKVETAKKSLLKSGRYQKARESRNMAEGRRRNFRVSFIL